MYREFVPEFTVPLEDANKHMYMNYEVIYNRISTVNRNKIIKAVINRYLSKFYMYMCDNLINMSKNYH